MIIKWYLRRGTREVDEICEFNFLTTIRFMMKFNPPLEYTDIFLNRSQGNSLSVWYRG